MRVRVAARAARSRRLALVRRRRERRRAGTRRSPRRRSPGSELELERRRRRPPGRSARRTPYAPVERHERRRVVDVEPVEVRRGPAAGGGAGARILRCATKAVRAPFRSSSAFVATVVPCVKRSSAGRPARSSTSCRRLDHRRPPGRARVSTFAVVQPCRRASRDGVRERAADVDAEDRHRRIRPRSCAASARRVAV